VTVPRVVLDTNVLVSGLLGGAGLPVLKRWRSGGFVLVVSPEIFAEYSAVLSRPKFGLPEWLVSDLLGFIREQAEWVEPDIGVEVARDPADDKFLAAAIYGQADCVVSGDRDLLDLKVFEGIPIVSPWEFAQ